MSRRETEFPSCCRYNCPPRSVKSNRDNHPRQPTRISASCLVPFLFILLSQSSCPPTKPLSARVGRSPDHPNLDEWSLPVRPATRGPPPASPPERDSCRHRRRTCVGSDLAFCPTSQTA